MKLDLSIEEIRAVYQQGEDAVVALVQAGCEAPPC
jgi:hypothetical protein